MPKQTEDEAADAAEEAAYRESRLVPMWAGFVAASMASGQRPVKAANGADAALQLMKARFKRL